MIDDMHEEDTVEVYVFIGYLKMKRGKEVLHQKDIDSFAEDKELVRQIQKSCKKRMDDQIYDQERISTVKFSKLNVDKPIKSMGRKQLLTN